MKKVGILGAGQLGCMLAESLFKLGAQVCFYDTQPNAPGFSRTPHSFCGAWTDTVKLKEFFSQCDVVTYEFENVSVELLEQMTTETGTPLHPSADILSLTQNRLHEKNFLKATGLPVCHFMPAYSKEELQHSLQEMTLPCLIKTATGGYDGKGQWRISNEARALEFLETNTVYPLILEEIIPIYKEISCIVARDKNGTLVHFPLFENEHKNQILDKTFLPAQLPLPVQEEIIQISTKVCESLNLVGVFTTEFFITQKEDEFKIYVNEFAPRPHNSGHITRVACNVSQFDALAHILLELPLQTPTLSSKHYCMTNLLGDVWVNQGKESATLDLARWEQSGEIKEILLYGKDKPVLKRKMGHFIVEHNSRERVIAVSDKFMKEINDK